MNSQNENTAMADCAILSLARKPRTYSELATFVRLLNDNVTPESLHGDNGHINRLENAGFITVGSKVDGQPTSRSIISITDEGIGHMRGRGWPLMPLGDSLVRSFSSPAPA